MQQSKARPAPCTMYQRYAIYYCPRPDSVWWARGSQWLGRCAVRQQQLQIPAIAGLSEEVTLEITRDPRRYGWHATLKAPFALVPGTTESMLREALRSLAQGTKSFDVPALQVQDLGHFLALVPQVASDKLNALAATCVTELHHFAAPLTDSELARRRKSQLSSRQDTLLVQWGYPYVLDEFRFHCSLTSDLRDLTASQREAIVTAATKWFDNLSPPRLDSLALVAEPKPGADFVVLEHADLAP